MADVVNPVPVFMKDTESPGQEEAAVGNCHLSGRNFPREEWACLALHSLVGKHYLFFSLVFFFLTPAGEGFFSCGKIYIA